VLLDVSSERAKQRDKNTVVTVNNILQMSGLTGTRMNGVCCRKCEEGVVMKQLVSVFCTWQLISLFRNVAGTSRQIWSVHPFLLDPHFRIIIVITLPAVHRY